jgi:hypothetical protein
MQVQIHERTKPGKNTRLNEDTEVVKLAAARGYRVSFSLMTGRYRVFDGKDQQINNSRSEFGFTPEETRAFLTTAPRFVKAPDTEAG